MSIGSAAAQGIESGFSLGLRADEAKQRRYEFERTQADRDAAQQRLSKQEDDRYGRMNDTARVQAVQARLSALEKQATAIAQTGHEVPPSLQSERAQLAIQLEDMQQEIATTGRLKPTGSALTSAAPRPNVASADTAPAPAAAPLSAAPQPAAESAQPPAVPGGAPPTAAVASPVTSARTPTQQFVADSDQQAQNLSSRLSTGQVSLADVAPGDFALMVASATKRDPRQLDQVRQHISDWEAGMQTGNNGLMLQGVNGIFGPQIAQGVGSPSAFGGTVTGKSVIGLDPAMSADGSTHADKVIPRLRVTTDLKGPDGAPMHYDAPMTVNRSSSPDDQVRAVSMGDAFNHVGALSTLVTAAAHPDAQAKIAEGVKDPRVQQYLDNYALASAPANPALVKENQIQAYMKAAGVDRDTATQRMIALGALPRPPATKGAIAQTMDAAEQLVANGEAPDVPTALGLLQRAGVTKQPTKYSPIAGAGAPAGAGGANAATLITLQGKGAAPGALKSETVDFYATQSLMGDHSWQVGLARGKVGQALIAAVKDRIPQMAKELNLSPQDVGTNKATYAALSRTLADRTKYVTAVTQLNGTLDRQASLVESLLAKGGATEGGPLFNAPFNKIREKLGSADAHNLEVALTGLAREHQRVLVSPMSNAQLMQSAAATGDKLLNMDLTPSQILGTITVMRTEAQNGLDEGQRTLGGVKTQIRGLAAPTSATGAPAPAGAAPSAAPVQIKDAAGYNALPPGTEFIDPNGNHRRKP